jgi:hypothetical protein
MILAMAARRCVLGCALLAAAPAWATPRAKPITAPKLATGARTFVAFAGQPASVKVAWPPVAGATHYRARWTTGPQVVDVDLTTAVFERPEPAAGPHLLSVFAIDAGGVESAPADLAIDVITIEALPPGSHTASSPPPGAFAIGSTFSSPGMRCQLGSDTPAMEVVAHQFGAFPLRCGGEAGEPTVEVPVVIAPILVQAELAPVARETTTKVHLTIASVGAIGEHLDIAAIGDLDLGPAERVAGGIDVAITPSASATVAGLIVRANRLELGRVSIDLVDAPKPAPVIEPESEWFALDLGAQIGGFLPPDVGTDANSLGHPIDAGDTISSGPLVGLRVGLFPTRRVGLELESSLAISSYTGRLGVAGLLINRAQIAARLVEDGRFGLRGLIGGDVLTTTTASGTSKVGSLGGLHYGAAFSVETRPGVSVRIQALDVITIAQDAGYAHCLELQIGVVTRLGRRDRWK